MEKEGKYIYCITRTNIDRNFGAIGIGGRGAEVSTIGYDDLSMVVSNHPMTKLIVNRENMLAHERVIEEVMKEFAVLPVRFCTIAASADEIRNLLDRRHKEFKNLLRDIDHKVELGVKAIWKNMDMIFKELTKENSEIKKLKERIQKEAERFIDILRKVSVDFRLNRTISEEMFMNAAFLVDNGKEKELDNIMDDLSREYGNRVRFMYAGPFPPYNFVNITIYPEEWEK